MNPVRIELPTNFAVGSVNAYLFTEPEVVLVDTGVKTEVSWVALQAGLEKHGLTVSDLERVVITHPHVDHFGQAGRITALSEAQVWVSELGVSWLVNFEAMWQKRLSFYRDIFLGPVGFSPETIERILVTMSAAASVCDPVPAERVSVFRLDDTLQMGGMNWQVLHTPGHASNQTCFYQSETRQFLAADMLLAKTPTPIVERPVSRTQRTPTLPQFLNSLSLVESLDIDAVYPGHGKPFTDHRGLINRQRGRIQKRKAECLDLVVSGYDTVAQLVAKMYAHLPEQFRFAGLWMLVGYLDLLQAEGMLIEKEIDGVWHYQKKEIHG